MAKKMISIIVCSRRADILDVLEQNIADTIGCGYELCVIDNSHNEYNIFSAYNEGVRRAKGEVLCFIHEDLCFHSKNWGLKLETAFSQHSDIGCIGVVGGQYLSREIVPWWESSPTVGQIMQGYYDKNGEYHVTTGEIGKVRNLTDVVAVDGCFLVMPKKIFDDVCWDSESYGGFHMYDIDICLQILSINRRVCVIPDMIVEHTSIGNKNSTYFSELKKFNRKWGDILPIYRGIQLNQSEILWRENLMKKWCQLYQIRSSHLYQMLKTLFGNWKTIIYNN